MTWQMGVTLGMWAAMYLGMCGHYEIQIAKLKRKLAKLAETDERPRFAIPSRRVVQERTVDWNAPKRRLETTGVVFVVPPRMLEDILDHEENQGR